MNFKRHEIKQPKLKYRWLRNLRANLTTSGACKFSLYRKLTTVLQSVKTTASKTMAVGQGEWGKGSGARTVGQGQWGKGSGARAVGKGQWGKGCGARAVGQG